MGSALAFLWACFALLTALIPYLDAASNQLFVDPDLFEGDIVLGPETRTAFTRTKWPMGIVPYILDGNTPASELTDRQKEDLKAAIQVFHDKTCVRFVERLRQNLRKDETEFYTILRRENPSLCSSNIGISGDLKVSLGDNCGKREIIHELMHAIGFLHEQSRFDRDKFVKIKFENIESIFDKRKNQYVNMSKNFNQNNNTDTLGLPYDYCSIMHYQTDLFGKKKSNGGGRETTMEILRGPINCPYGHGVGQAQTLSVLDIERVNLLYNCDDSETTTSKTMTTPSATLDISDYTIRLCGELARGFDVADMYDYNGKIKLHAICEKENGLTTVSHISYCRAGESFDNACHKFGFKAICSFCEFY